MKDLPSLVAEYRQNVERAYGAMPYHKTRRARLYRKIFGRWSDRVVNERLYAVQVAGLQAEYRRRGLDPSVLDVLYPPGYLDV